MRPQETFDELVAIDRAADPHPRRWPLLLLVLPVVAVIVPAAYNHLRPHWLGMPFFIWYQFAAVLFGGVAAGFANLLSRDHTPPERSDTSGATPPPAAGTAGPPPREPDA